MAAGTPGSPIDVGKPPSFFPLCQSGDELELIDEDGAQESGHLTPCRDPVRTDPPTASASARDNIFLDSGRSKCLRADC